MEWNSTREINVERENERAVVIVIATVFCCVFVFFKSFNLA